MRRPVAEIAHQRIDASLERCDVAEAAMLIAAIACPVLVTLSSS